MSQNKQEGHTRENCMKKTGVREVQRKNFLEGGDIKKAIATRRYLKPPC